MFKLLDYMEYSSDALAQAAYVSNGTFPCLVFDGVNDVMSFPTSSIPLTSFTVEMWLWIGVRADYNQDIWHPSGKDWWLRCQEGDSPIIDTHIKDASNNYYNPSSISVEPEKWIHIAFQYDNSVGYVRNFLMGELNNEKDIGFKTFPNLDLGSQYPFGALAQAAYFKGKAAKIRVWNTVRTESQLKANMYSNLVGNEPGLVLCLNTNEGSGTSVDDVSSNNKNGTLSGTTWGTTDALTLQSYSESTIKTQGSYSLKGIAVATDSLNKTLTRTVSPTIDLTGINQVRFRIRSSRTGSNIKIGLHDSGGTTTEITPNILSADTWQEVKINLQNVANANKDAIDQLIFTIVNADEANTFYIDELISYTIPTIVIS